MYNGCATSGNMQLYNTPPSLRYKRTRDQFWSRTRRATIFWWFFGRAIIFLRKSIVEKHDGRQIFARKRDRNSFSTMFFLKKLRVSPVLKKHQQIVARPVLLQNWSPVLFFFRPFIRGVVTLIDTKGHLGLYL